MTDKKRLIEVDFPLEQVSLNSVHEKNVRHGHISTLHIWPARRPLAASRAVLIATLLPDPGNAEERKAIYHRLAGDVIETIEQKKVGGRTVEKTKRETRGGILHWGQEASPDLDWFRTKIQAAYGGRTPKLLDPFAGGGAIPLEAMRLGCEVTAIDINPVAWFLLKCTLEYPQKLAGQTRPLPAFALKDRDFMEAFFKAKGFKGASLKRELLKCGFGADGSEVEPSLLNHDSLFEADLAWHMRAWGRWIFDQARRHLAHRYPTYAEFQPIEPGGKPFEAQPLQLLEPATDGMINVNPLNANLDAVDLKDPRNPRWVVKPAVAYLWARTVRCKGCRATIPLLKTRWLAKKDSKRVLLTTMPNKEKTGVIFGIETNAPQVGGNAAQRREHDKRRGVGTMSRSGAQCQCCPTIMTSEDIRLEGRAGRLGQVMTAVVIEGPNGKEYRLPTTHELDAASVMERDLNEVFDAIPFGRPTEPIPLGGSRTGGGSPFTTPLFGIESWDRLFTERQLLSVGILVVALRTATREIQQSDHNSLWTEAIVAILSLSINRFADYNSNICNWDCNGEYITHTFQRFALPIKWDFSEIYPHSEATGGLLGGIDWIARCMEHAASSSNPNGVSNIAHGSAIQVMGTFDAIVTDPPYYDAIPYSDLMDFFYIWLRRATNGLSPEIDHAFAAPLGPKWDHAARDGELIDDPSRFGGSKEQSKSSYEDGMARAFHACRAALKDDGRLVVVFANKQP